MTDETITADAALVPLVAGRDGDSRRGRGLCRVLRRCLRRHRPKADEAAREARHRARQRSREERRAAKARKQQSAPGSAAPTILRAPRFAALIAIAVLVAAASLTSFAESYRGLYLWAHHHLLSGPWAAIWPLQVDVFIAVGELALFVALADGWERRSRIGAWLVTLAGLGVSVAGNVGHVAGHSVTSRGTAAVPPLAAAAALAVGLGVLKRVVARYHDTAQAADPGAVASDVIEAAKASLRATVAAGNPLSGNQLAERFSLTRAQATKLRQAVLAEANGHYAD